MGAYAPPGKFTDVRKGPRRPPGQAPTAQRRCRLTSYDATQSQLWARLGRGTFGAHTRFAMNEEESYDELILLEQPVLDDDLVEVASEPEDDYKPYEEVILLDMMHLDDDDLLEVA